MVEGTIGCEEEEKKQEINSYRSDFSSASSAAAIDRPVCLEILKQIISVKREQAFCQQADKEIFTPGGKSAF